MEKFRSDLQRAHRGERAALVMGVVTAGAESCLTKAVEAAIACGMQLIHQGAEVLDITLRSPGERHANLPQHDEAAFTLKVIEKLITTGLPICVTTDSAVVARQAIQVGVQMINDTGGLKNPDMVRTVAGADVVICATHKHGLPHLAHHVPTYPRGVVRELLQWGKEQLSSMRDLYKQGRLMLDPGIGLGKSALQSQQVLAALPEIHRLGAPLMVSLCNSASLRELVNSAPESLATATVALSGIISSSTHLAILRVQEVLAHRQLTDLQSAIRHVKAARDEVSAFNLCRT